MDESKYIIVEAKVKSVEGLAGGGVGNYSSQLEIELEENNSPVKIVECVGVFPIEKGDVIRIGFEKQIYIGHFCEGHIYKPRPGLCGRESANIVEKVRDGVVVATYRTRCH